MAVIPAFGRLRQEEFKVKFNLGYVARERKKGGRNSCNFYLTN
jgi:hypothetical protein